MKKMFSWLPLALCLGTPVVTRAQYQPVAAAKAIVQPEKQVRFTVLADGMVRMEWDSLGHFTDQASFVVVNRKLPVPVFSGQQQGEWYILHTPVLTLRYKKGAGRFNAGNLEVTYEQDGRHLLWRPGTLQLQNLKGTYRTLDRYDGNLLDGKTPMQLEDGILARDGWTLIDDSRSFLFDNAAFPWVDTTARHSSQDWYLLMYGHHYKTALQNYAAIGGKVPLPPRYAFGYWWSRYWRYSDVELRQLVDNFHRYNIPLDVLVIDMDWHQQGWTGWTWDNSLFTSPERFLEWTNQQHLKTTLNLHPADGVGPQEQQYTSFAKANNFDTSGHHAVPYVGSDKRFMQTLFDTILRPYEKQGVDFWWLDWQQWPDDPQVHGLDNTWWLNYVFFTEKEKYGQRRPLLYHRWGGLGNHRYQTGFSGDATISWRSLAFQPYFTSTASNVLYDYWSHDIGGHNMPAGFKSLDPELYTRWMQYGALSPIFRTHSTKSALLNKEIWNFSGPYFNAIYNAIRLRYTLAPYIYTMARQTYDSALAICRPLYYEHPDDDSAYHFTSEYYFGDDMLVAPIGKPSDNGVSKETVWLPTGNDWYEWHTGTLLQGGQTLTRHFTIDEYPLYVKAGAIIAMNRDSVKQLDGQTAAIQLGIFPGATGKGHLYEDDGDDQHYASQFSVTNYATSTATGGGLKLQIQPVKGHFPGMRTTRDYKLCFYGRAVPEAVVVAGKRLPYASTGNGPRWYYNGQQLCVEIYLPGVNALQGQTVSLQQSNTPAPDINGLPEKMKRLYQASEALKYTNAYVVMPYQLAQMEELPQALSYYPERYAQLINDFHRGYAQLDAILEKAGGISADEKAAFLQAAR